MTEISFEHYDSPIRARRVFFEYCPIWKSVPIESKNRILEAIASNTSPDDLDFALDGIFTKHASLRIGGGSPTYISDEDCNGSWGNCVRAYEE